MSIRLEDGSRAQIELDLDNIPTKTKNNEQKTVKYQHRYENPFNSSTILRHATVDDAQDAYEKRLIIKYHTTLQQIHLNEDEAHKLSEYLYQLRATDYATYREINNEVSNEIKKFVSDTEELRRELINIENNSILSNFIERKKEEAEKIRQERLELIRQEEKARAEEYQRELERRYQESRQKHLQKKQEEQQKQETLKQSIALEQPKPNQQDNNSSIKEKLIATLGGFGLILFYGLRLLVCILPFVMIGGNIFVTFLLVSIDFLFPFVSPIFWIWGLVCAIKGVQDVWAIIYYIAFIVIWIPFYISTIAQLFSKK